MDWLVLSKYLHVVFAVCWVGGGITLLVAGMLAERRNDDAGTAAILRAVVALSPVWFIPISLLTLLFGVVMAFGYGIWSEAWVALGLLGFLATFCIGVLVLKPTSEAFTAHYDAGRFAEAKVQGKRMLTLSKFDYVLLFAVIFDMVFRPQWGDVVPLAIMALAIAGAAILFLLPALRNTAAAA